MATKFTTPNSFNLQHTQGDTFDKTITVVSPSTWAGYSSGKCEIRDMRGTLAFALLVDISVPGQLRLHKADPVAPDLGTYFFDIQWTMSDGSLKTWVNNDQTLFTFKITGQSTQ